MNLTKGQSVFCIEADEQLNKVVERKVIDIQASFTRTYVSTTGGVNWETQEELVCRLEGLEYDYSLNEDEGYWGYALFTDREAAKAKCAEVNNNNINYFRSMRDGAIQYLKKLGIEE